MNTRKILLKSTAKAVMIAVLICAAGITSFGQRAAALSNWELQQDYLLYLLYEDIQVRETHMPPSAESYCIRWEQLPDNESHIGWWTEESVRNTGWLGLAKNEKEGFQIFFREHQKSRNLRIEVSPFLNTQNEELEHSLYYEEFFYAEPYTGFNAPDSLAEALVPYFGEPKVTQIGHNKAFFVELSSSKDQTPGEYVSTITAYDGDSVLTTRTMTAKVWNFALPEGHYSEVVMGLHNRNSGYPSTSSLFTLNGIPVNNGIVAPEYLDEAKRVLEGYQNCLLDHGVSTYEIPRWLMDDDTKAAELTMADPRRKMFTVPILYGDMQYPAHTDFTLEAKQVLQQYKDIVYDNPFLKDKAFFYPKDEPKNASDFAAIDQFCSVLSGYWPEYHATVPFYSDYDSTVAAFDGKIDILCPTKGFFNPGIDFSNNTLAEQRLQDYMTRSHTWWKPDDAKTGGVDYFVFITSSVGVMRRILFWQQYVVHSDGLLYWNCAYLPDNWQKKYLQPKGGIQQGNGDGVLLYPGTQFGQDAASPVVSLRLKQLSAGIDDYDYLCLAKEFLGEQTVAQYLYSRLFYTNNYFPAYTCAIMNKELEVFVSYTCHSVQITRWWLGKLLNEASNTEHNWGEWETAVLPDETHDGLEIRTCQNCGAQESRPKPYSSLYRFVGTEDDQWTNLSNWANNPEVLPTPGEAVIIAHDCEINTDITVFHVVVNEGFNLTINEGATLVSKWVTTEENAQIIIEDGGQLIHNSNGVMATVKKNVIGHSADDGGYVFISTPTADDADPSQVSGLLTGDYDLYRFDATASDGLEWRNYKNDSFNMSNGIGYLYSNPNDVELNFTATVRASNTPEVKTPSFSEGYLFGGWNLLGNPFTCNAYLSTDAEGMAFYRMNAEGDGYEAATDAIRPLEGFFVQADSAGQSFTISREQPERTRSELQLRIVKNVDNPEAQHVTDNAIIRFGKGNTLEKISFRGHNAKLYIPQDGKDYAVVNADSLGELPIHFEATENGTYTLNTSIEDVNFSYLHLIDNQTKADVDLLQTSSYSFEAKVTDNSNRFKLVYSISTIK